MKPNALKRTLVGVGGTAALALLGLFTVRALLISAGCDKYETVLSVDTHGRTVRSTLQACMIFGADNEVWVDLELPSGSHQRLMSFVPWGGELGHPPPYEPVAAWQGANELRISIGTIGELIEAKDNVAGVHVTYEINSIIYK